MFKIFRTFLLILFLVSTTTSVYSETSWITKKTDKTKVELKKEKKEKKEKKKKWIAKKKKNIKKFKEKSKNISKEVKSWITKKDKKDKYIKSIEELPKKAQIYFVARSVTGDVYFGYTKTKRTSKKISSADGKIKIKKNSEGFAYLNDGKTVCKVSSEILAVIKKGRYFGEVHANCSNDTNFNGDFSQKENTGNGTLIDNNGNDIFFTFYQDLNVASETYAKFFDGDTKTTMARLPKPKSDIEVKGKYYALLIGNSKYSKWATLKSPKHDVKDIKKILDKKYEFKFVDVVYDTNRQELIDAILKISKKITENDYLLIYYSGHGTEDEGENYWIPVESGMENDGSWINNRLITSYIKKIKAKHILLMTDSCYSTFSSKGIDAKEILKVKLNDEGLTDALNSQARQVLRSGGNYPVPDAQVGNNSLFAFKFIDILNNNDNEITVSSVYALLKKHHRNVKKKGFKNIPKLDEYPTWGHLEGEFIFIAKKK